MNTTKKGNAFEKEVYDYIQQELYAGRLPLNPDPNLSKIYCKQKYFSPARDAKIEVDVSIESYLPGATKWSSLWIFECKDYEGRVPVDDVEELHAKREQIARDNSKAVLVIRGSIQKSALNLAKSYGIAVIRLLSNNQVNWQLPFLATSSLSQAYEVVTALTDSNFRGVSRSFYGYYDSYVYSSLDSLLQGADKSIGRVPEDLTHIIPNYKRQISPFIKSEHKLQNRILYRHIQTAFEYIKSRDSTYEMPNDVAERLYLVPLQSVFAMENLPNDNSKQIANVSTGTIDSFTAATDVANISAEIQDDYATQFSNDKHTKIQQLGLEAYALYLPIHFFFSGNQFDTDWGIYISEAGIAKVAFALKSKCRELFGEPKQPNLANAVFTKIAYQILLRHELYHFKIEFFTLNSELLIGKPLYTQYIRDVYAANQFTDECLEEAFANSTVLNSGVIENLFKSIYGDKKLADKFARINWRRAITEGFFEVQPPGYNNYDLDRGWPTSYDAHTRLKKRQRAMNYLCNQIVQGSQKPKGGGIPFYAFPPENYFLRAENLVPINIVKIMTPNRNVLSFAPPKKKETE